MTSHPFRAGVRRTVLVAGAVVAAACSSDLTLSSPFGPSEEPAATLNILSVAASSPAPEAGSVTFVARKGRRTEGRVYLSDGHGHRGTEYLRLTVDKNSLLTRPDGTPFADGDSVAITIRVADPTRILFEMLPAGLTFSADSPAELRIRYDVAGEDLDHTGGHDAQDDSVETHLGIWRQSAKNTSFVRLPSSVTRSHKEVRADVPGFSRYAIAY